jgi:KTSC domain-containing protein
MADSLLRRIAMRAAALSSSLISRIAYDEEERTLDVRFRSGSRYVYYDVPRSEFDALRCAPSPGRYYNTCIKGRYRCAFDPDRRRFRPQLEAAE